MSMTVDDFISRLLLLGFKPKDVPYALGPPVHAPYDSTRFKRDAPTRKAIFDVKIFPEMHGYPLSGAPGEESPLPFRSYAVLLDSHYSETQVGWYYRVPRTHPDPFQRALDIILQEENVHG